MIKGTRKQMIVLRTGGSRYFDTAYFVLRERASEQAAHSDILHEANRILSEAAPRRDGTHARSARRPFLRGFLLGALSAFLLLAVPLTVALWTGVLFF